MNSQSPAPSSGRGRVRSMSQRQIDAYLLARDAVRRIQRTSSLVETVARQAAASVNRSQGERHPGH